MNEPEWWVAGRLRDGSWRPRGEPRILAKTKGFRCAARGRSRRGNLQKYAENARSEGLGRVALPTVAPTRNLRGRGRLSKAFSLQSRHRFRVSVSRARTQPTMEPLDPCPDPCPGPFLEHRARQGRACDGAPSGGFAPEVLLARAIERGDFRRASRRGFLVAAGFALPALAFLGCAPARSTTLPGAAWARAEDLGPTPGPVSPAVATATPRVVLEQNPIAPAALPYARPRALWARGEPDYAELNPMLPVRAITVHHDGLDSLVTGTSPREMTDRLELYRVGHRAQGDRKSVV